LSGNNFEILRYRSNTAANGFQVSRYLTKIRFDLLKPDGHCGKENCWKVMTCKYVLLLTSLKHFRLRQDVSTFCTWFPSVHLEMGTDANLCTEIRESARILLAAERALKRREEPKTEASTVETPAEEPVEA
jgi:hypothetical protein